MVIVRLLGGLGNQMFQYALSVGLKHKGLSVKYDNLWLEDNIKYLGENIIYKIFDLNLDFATESEISIMSYDSMRFMHRVGRKIGLVKRNHIYEKLDWRGEFQEEILKNSDNKYLDGYWQAERYFKDYEQEIKNAFEFRKDINDVNQRVLSDIEASTDSVAIHVRLGDYQNEENAKVFGGICTEAYYKSAFAYIESKVNNPTYFLFSNEPDKARYLVENRKHYIVDCNNSINGWRDLYLMTKCNHNIIANSTFSWWGAYLNRNPSKIVVIPKKWTQTAVRNGMYVDGWILI